MPPAFSRATILVVEDEILVARDIALQLVALGYEPVGHAIRGEEALELAGKLQPDLVLMDIQLTGSMDGIAAAQAIRNQFALPVVFLTAFAADDIMERIRLAGTFDCILNPFSQRELRAVIEMALYKQAAQAKLSLSEAFSSAILDSVSAEIVVLDQLGIIIAVNEPWCRWALEKNIGRAAPAPPVGVGSNYLAACQVGDGFALKEDGRRAADGIQSVLDGNLASFSLEYACHSRDHKRWSGMSVTPLRLKRRGAVVAHTDITDRKLAEELSAAHFEIFGTHFVSAIMQDISQRKQAEQALIAARDQAQASARHKALFLANMSHEIRTPINGIMGLTELVLGTELESEQREHLELAYASASGLLGVINDVLDFSKIEAGKLELEDLCIDLRQTLNEAVRPLGLRASAKGLRLLLRVADDVPQQVRGDPSRLRQIISNLADNAIKFTQAGEVVVRVLPELTSAAEVQLHFAVHDTGVGIPEHRLEAIFESFTQVDNSTHRDHGGTGLGLAVCSRLVQLMRGSIWAESQTGLGSVFHFILPFGRQLTPGIPPDFNKVLAHPAQVHASKSLQILLAEDNPVNQKFVVGILTRAGHLVVVAQDGQEAVDLAITMPFDIIVMDLLMPVIDGFHATRLIREHGITVPIIAVTAHALKGLREQCLAAGMTDYLSKPVRGSTLLAKLAELQGDDLGVAAPAPIPAQQVAQTVSQDAPFLLIDLASALELTDGDVAMLRTMADMVLTQIKGDLPGLRTLASAQDGHGLHKAAHRLKASLASVGANAAHAACLALENMALAQRSMEFDAGMARLDDALARVIPELIRLAQTPDLQPRIENGN